MSRHRVRFAPADDAADTNGPVALPGPAAFNVDFPGGAEHVDLSDLPCPRLARALAVALAETTTPKDLIDERRNLRSRVREIRRFVEFTAASMPGYGAALQLDDLQPELLDAYEQKLITDYGDKTSTAYSNMAGVMSLLRHIRDSGPAAFNLSFQARLNVTAMAARRDSNPLDAYPFPVAEALERAAMSSVGKIRDRIIAGERLASNGQDPGIHGWDRLENVLWHIAQHGPLTRDQRSPAIIKLGGIARLNEHLFPSYEDMTPFHVLIACQTGLEPECIRQLSAGCLASPARSYVSIQYIKRRSHGGPEKSIRVRDTGSLRSPGGVIRLALRLTQRARDVSGSTALWTVVLQNGTIRPAYSSVIPSTRYNQLWLAANGLEDLGQGPGKQASLDLRRIRKTYKSKRYLETGGILPDFASGHTSQVAGRHYADIGAHEEIHDQAIEAGLTEALSVALPPPVVLDTDGARLDTGPADITPETVRDSMNGATDVWLSSCKDFFNSPWALKSGAPCPVPPWVCLECPNAVFTSRHLPAVLSALDSIQRQRDELPPAEWTARFGLAHERIINGILARFRTSQIETARAIAESDGSRLALPASFLEMLS